MSDFKFASKESELECKRYLLVGLERICSQPTFGATYDEANRMRAELEAELAPVRMKYPDFLRPERNGEAWKSPAGKSRTVFGDENCLWLEDECGDEVGNFTLSELTEEWELVR